MKKIAIFPGSFDPFTIGHEEIVKRGLSMFDTIIVAIGKNSSKNTMLSLDKRIELINKVFKDETRVEVDSYEGLTINYCKDKGAKFLLRGLRTAADFEYERAIAQMNKNMNDDVESVFLLTAPIHTPICSTIVRDIFNNEGDISEFLPSNISMNDLR
jgi:pantetheine-phosphate adenylyltransferase